MDEWSLALLSCKLSLIGVNTGEPIKRRGQNSDFAYIMLGGTAKVCILHCALWLWCWYCVVGAVLSLHLVIYCVPTESGGWAGF